MKTMLEILKAARELLNDEERWTQKSFAKDIHGFPVAAGSSDAVCFCMMGALAKVSESNTIVSAVYLNESAQSALSILEWTIEGHIPTFNDEHTHAEVLIKFDEAIAKAELRVC